jgi:tetratricopeptide (TPR) repeat protein
VTEGSRIRSVLLLACCLGCVASGCAGDRGDPGRPPEEIPDPAGLPVPDPDLGEMEPALAAVVNDLEAAVASRAGNPEADPREVGKAFGDLGQLYHIFDLLDAAEIAYDNARRLLPGEYRWIYLQALVRVDKGELEAAEQGLVRALELRPESLAAWIRLGDVRLDLNRPEDAHEAFEKARELDSDSAAAEFGLGRVEAALGRTEEAVARFERALELQPQASVVHYPLAQAYRRLGRTEEAERELRRRGDRRVHFPDPPVDELSDLQTLVAFRVLGSLAQDLEVPPEQLLTFAISHLGRVEGTLEPLEKVLGQWDEQGVAPERIARLHYAAGGILVQQRSDDRAIEQFRAAVREDPDFVDAHIKLGNALARSGRLEEAVAEFTRALELAPDDRELRLKRATVLLNRGRTGEAIEELRRLARQAPDDPTARIRIAEALEASGDFQGADREYRSALSGTTAEGGLAAPAQARIHRAYGLFHQRRGRFEEAVEEYRQALELDRKLVGARRDLAAVLGHLRRYSEAASEYAQVTATVPDDEPARWGEALALILDSRPAEAVRTLEEGVAVVSDGVALRSFLARILAIAPDDGIRRGSKALELAKAVYDERPLPSHAETVAMAYAETGSFEKAVEWQRRVIDQLDPGPAAERAKERLELYEAGKPFRARSLEDLVVTTPAEADESQEPGDSSGDSGRVASSGAP